MFVAFSIIAAESQVIIHQQLQCGILVQWGPKVRKYCKDVFVYNIYKMRVPHKPALLFFNLFGVTTLLENDSSSKQL